MRAFLRRNPWIWILLFMALLLAGDICFIAIAQRFWEGVEILP